MDIDLTDEPTVSVPVETLRVGDAIFVHHTIGFALVSAVEIYDADVVVAYFHYELENYGIRRNQRRINEKALAPKHLGELVSAKRGAPELAQVMRAEMVAQQRHRWATIQSKSEAG